MTMPTRKPERADYHDDKSFEDAMMKYLHDTDQVFRPRLEPLTREQLYGNKKIPPSSSKKPQYQQSSPSRPSSSGASGWYAVGGFFIILGLIFEFYASWALWWTDQDVGFYFGGGAFFLVVGFVLLAIGTEVSKRNDSAFMARREKRQRYRDNARRKKRGY
jgi:hypothetical protein